MDRSLLQLIPQLQNGENAPEWLSRLLHDTPGLPAEAVPHKRPNHADLQPLIADAAFHPAIEACLHLINADLYSAHFLVRKAQGGSRYLDWLHAILHKLEGDFRNAKMWYTDMGNNNRRAMQSLSSATHEQSSPPRFVRFHQFWLIPSANGGDGERVAAQSVVLDCAAETPRELGLTAHQHTDLVFLASFSASSASKDESTRRAIQKHFRATSENEAKIRESSSAFAFDELVNLRGRIDAGDVQRDLIGCLTKVELVWLLSRMVEDFGWHGYTAAEAVEALQLESTPAHTSTDTERKGKATNMVLDPAMGQRRF